MRYECFLLVVPASVAVDGVVLAFVIPFRALYCNMWAATAHNAKSELFRARRGWSQLLDAVAAVEHGVEPRLLALRNMLSKVARWCCDPT